MLVLLTVRCSTLFKSRESFVSSDQTTIPGICFSELCLFEAQREKFIFKPVGGPVINFDADFTHSLNIVMTTAAAEAAV